LWLERAFAGLKAPTNRHINIALAQAPCSYHSAAVATSLLVQIA
jgi:hypothetical protein